MPKVSGAIHKAMDDVKDNFPGKGSATTSALSNTKRFR